MSDRSPAQLLTMLIADNWLHFVLGVALIGLGFATTRARRLVRAT